MVLKDSDIFRFWRFPVLKDSDIFRFWGSRVFKNSKIFKFWHLTVLKDYDIFRLWSFLVLKDSDNFRFWHVHVSLSRHLLQGLNISPALTWCGIIQCRGSSTFHELDLFIDITSCSSDILKKLILHYKASRPSGFKWFWHFQILTLFSFEGFGHIHVLTFSVFFVFLCNGRLRNGSNMVSWAWQQ